MAFPAPVIGCLIAPAVPLMDELLCPTAPGWYAPRVPGSAKPFTHYQEILR